MIAEGPPAGGAGGGGAAPPGMNIDIEHLRSWIGRSAVVDEVVTTTPLRALAATLA